MISLALKNNNNRGKKTCISKIRSHQCSNYTTWNTFQKSIFSCKSFKPLGKWKNYCTQPAVAEPLSSVKLNTECYRNFFPVLGFLFHKSGHYFCILIRLCHTLHGDSNPVGLRGKTTLQNYVGISFNQILCFGPAVLYEFGGSMVAL